jgi:tRNA(Arg) A34 adenosine deaminase TadA
MKSTTPKASTKKKAEPKASSKPATKTALLSNEDRMKNLISFTAKSFETPFPTPFGAEVIETKTQKLVVRCLNHVGQDLDPSQHAEVHALRKACKKLKSVSLKGHTLFTTCEPCPMCMSAILWAGLDGVVFAASIDDASLYCDQIYISAEEVSKKSDMPCKVVGPVEQKFSVTTLFENPKMRAVYRSWKKKKP